MPTKWESCTIADLGTVITGKTPSTSNAEYWGNEHQFITPKDIQITKHVLQTDRALSANGLRAVYSSIIPKNAICVSCIGNIGYVAMTTDVSVTNQQINSIIPNNDNEQDFEYF